MNRTLRRIAPNCVEDTGGYFVTLPDDDLDYQKCFIASCHRAGIPAEAVDPAEVLRQEPAVNPAIIGAVRVPDGAVDPFRLTIANVVDAQRYGADVVTYHEVEHLLMSRGGVVGVALHDMRSGYRFEVHGSLVINAAGIWGHLIAKMAGIEVGMTPMKGALLVFGHRVNNAVINRCRKPADADILVPGDTISLIGTTSTPVAYDQIDHIEVTPQEVDILIREGTKMVPSLAYTRVLRAYAGVRPLVSDSCDPTGRSISRGIVCFDHSSRDGIEGFITITGGKLMTYRLMAEQATDLVCRKLGINAKCTTAVTPLPDGEVARRYPPKSAKLAVSAPDREQAVVCECEQVTIGEIRHAVNDLHVGTLVDLRRRTRIGMGTCQSQLCAARAASVMARIAGYDRSTALANLRQFIAERWKGMYPVAWGNVLAEAQLMEWVYRGICGLDIAVSNALALGVTYNVQTQPSQV